MIARARAKKALLRGEYSFYKNLSKAAPSFYKTFQADKLCPPRKSWVRLKRDERAKLSPIKITELAVYRTILYNFQKSLDAKKEWAINLNEFIQDIKEKVSSPNGFSFSEPSIIPEIKDDKFGSYRPISVFSLKEKIVASLTSRYLCDLFEEFWGETDSAYAFRRSKRVLTHHSAIEDILDYKGRHKQSYVAECDIMKFFDSVNHNKTVSIFEKYIHILANRGIFLDGNAINIFISYLNSYTFVGTVLKKSAHWFENSNISRKDAHFEWIEISLTERGLNIDDRIGVPQGGALSCFVANLILHEVDLDIKKEGDDALFYARYCDDMVIIHPNKDECFKYLSCYIHGLEKQNLFHHPPEELVEYGATFWKSKSKAPYKWDISMSKENVPWLSFVGYQLRYDGVLRVRPKSIKKEKVKQVRVIDNALKCINIGKKKKAEENVRLNSIQIIYRVRKKLLAMSVGVIEESALSNGNKFCWVEGFKLLKFRKIVKSQIRSLDRNRTRQIWRLERHLAKIKTPPIKKNSIKFREPDRYDSFLLSYYRQFKE